MREWVGVARQFLFRSCIEHVLIFGALLANCFATWRAAIAQPGCLSCGSLLANQRRRSAIRQSFVAGRPAAARARQCALAGQRTASRSRGFRHRWLALEIGIAKLEGIEPSPPMCFAIALRRATSQHFTGRCASGKISGNQGKAKVACKCQKSKYMGRSTCSQRPLLRARA